MWPRPRRIEEEEEEERYNFTAEEGDEELQATKDGSCEMRMRR